MSKCPKCGSSVSNPNVIVTTANGVNKECLDIRVAVITCPGCETILGVIQSPFSFWQALEKRLRVLVDELGGKK